MLVWLDGRTNTKAKPQENFGREIMELFTVGVGNYTESDVYAAARVFSGWNMARVGGAASDPASYQAFQYFPNQHETTAKTFSFAIYPDGGKTIPARAAADGMQDGIDFINGLAAHPNTARYLATKLYRFFVSEFGAVNVTFVNRVASVYLQNGGDMKAVMKEVLLSPELWDDSAYFARYSWPVEFVTRALQGCWLDRLLGERCADAAVQHGTDPLRAAGRQRLGPRSDVVLDQRDARAHELRVDARRQPEIQSGDGGEGGRREQDAGSAALVLRRVR